MRAFPPKLLRAKTITFDKNDLANSRNIAEISTKLPQRDGPSAAARTGLTSHQSMRNLLSGSNPVELVGHALSLNEERKLSTRQSYSTHKSGSQTERSPSIQTPSSPALKSVGTKDSSAKSTSARDQITGQAFFRNGVQLSVQTDSINKDELLSAAAFGPNSIQTPKDVFSTVPQNTETAPVVSKSPSLRGSGVNVVLKNETFPVLALEKAATQPRDGAVNHQISLVSAARQFETTREPQTLNLQEVYFQSKTVKSEFSAEKNVLMQNLDPKTKQETSETLLEFSPVMNKSEHLKSKKLNEAFARSFSGLEASSNQQLSESRPIGSPPLLRRHASSRTITRLESPITNDMTPRYFEKRKEVPEDRCLASSPVKASQAVGMLQVDAIQKSELAENLDHTAPSQTPGKVQTEFGRLSSRGNDCSGTNAKSSNRWAILVRAVLFTYESIQIDIEKEINAEFNIKPDDYVSEVLSEWARSNGISKQAANIRKTMQAKHSEEASQAPSKSIKNHPPIATERQGKVCVRTLFGGRAWVPKDLQVLFGCKPAVANMTRA